jgi:hypothetical protein
VLLDSNSTALHTNWHWQLKETIPSYLAGVAIAPYTIVKKNLTGINGITEAWIACLPGDTNKVNGSFAKLQESFTMLENKFGAYAWPRVGYSLVPFSGGAMEHAANIHIGAGFIDGALTHQTLIAHELSHHWFGNLVTCNTAQDMWLNEGFASYCELLHTEYVSGSNAYLAAYRALHFNMLSKAHINDDGYRAIAGMDSNYTYGTTVYSKGSDMMHTLRSYMGDSLFFAGLKNYLNNNKYSDANTNTLTASLSNFSGLNISNFTDAWIKQPGFANFTIDSIQTKSIGANFNLNIFVRQRKHKNTAYYNAVPLPINFYKKDFSYETQILPVSGRCATLSITLPYKPEFVCLDANDNLSDASTWDVKEISSIGTKLYDQGKARASIKTIASPTDTVLLRLEHHWVAPDRFKTAPSNFVMNDVRYWRIDGVNLDKLTGSFVFPYNATSTNNFLDSSWLKNSEDSLKLFYRKDATQDWQATNDSLIAGANKFDKIGLIASKNLLAGDYAIGIRRSGYIDTLQTDASGIPCAQVLDSREPFLNLELHEFMLFPNPANQQLVIKCNNKKNTNVKYAILNAQGQSLQKGDWQTNNDLKIATDAYANGLYIAQILQEGVSKNYNFIIQN